MKAQDLLEPERLDLPPKKPKPTEFCKSKVQNRRLIVEK